MDTKDIKIGSLITNGYRGPDLNGAAFVTAKRGDRIFVGGRSRHPRVPGAQTGRAGEHPRVGYWVTSDKLRFVETLTTDDGKTFETLEIV